MTHTPNILKEAMERVGDRFDAVRAKERERCAEAAYQRGRALGEPSIGHDIAQTIRNLKD